MSTGETTWSHGHSSPSASQPQYIDPVCGMKVAADPQKHVKYKDADHYFCSTRCMSRFSADPDRFLAEAVAAPAPIVHEVGAPGTIYTCPMHPEIRQDHPGDCPKCGMALEPEMPSLEDEENPELQAFERRFWWTLPLTVVVFVLAMFGHRLAVDGHAGAKLGGTAALAPDSVMGRVPIL